MVFPFGNPRRVYTRIKKLPSNYLRELTNALNIVALYYTMRKYYYYYYYYYLSKELAS